MLARHGISRGSQAALLVTLVQTGCATGGKPPPHAVVEPWLENGLSGKRITTEHFDVFTTVLDAQLVTALPWILEAAHDEFEKFIPSAAAPRKLNTYFFNTRSEWARFCRQRWPSRFDAVRRIHVGGFTAGDTSASFFVDRSTALATLVHEAWHQYAAARFEGMPAWLHEGMACYFESFELDDGGRARFLTTRNTFRLASLREALALRRWRPLSCVLNAHTGEFLMAGDGHATQQYYAQVWALMVFMNHHPDPAYPKRFDKLLQDIAAGTVRSTASAWRLTGGAGEEMGYGEVVFRAYVHEDPSEMDAALQSFARQLCGL